MLKVKKLWSLLGIMPLMGILLISACSFGGGSAEEAVIPTNTLASILSRTPRFTATPVISRTPLPTFTPIPSETPIPPTPSNTLEPTATPPIIGIINSLQSVNVRAGPSTADDAILALNPGTGVEVLGTNIEGNWYNIRTEEGDEGWVSSGLVRLQPTPTAIPTFTTTPDLTALFLGTPLPTALLGGGTVTPTPPRSAVTATSPGASGAGTTAAVVTTETSIATQPFLPIRDLTAVYQTATALASGNAFITPRPGDANSPTPPSLSLPLTPGTITVPTAAILSTPAPSTPGASALTTSGSAVVQQGVDVFALCDNPSLGAAAPNNIAAGSTVEVYWAWFASTQQQIQDHESAVTYEVRLNDTLLTNWRQYGTTIRPQGNQVVKYWYVPVGALSAGQYRISYRATWSRQIFDGSTNYGPGTNNLVEEGSCSFTVR